MLFFIRFNKMKGFFLFISLLAVTGSCTRDEVSLTNTRKDMTDKLRGLDVAELKEEDMPKL